MAKKINPKSQTTNNQSLIQIAMPNALERLQKKGSRRSAPVDYSYSLPAHYNKQLQALISAINDDIKNEVIPLIHRLKPEFTADAWPTTINNLLTAIGERWTGQAFKSQAERIAAGTLRRVEAENGAAFLKSVNKAVGVEVFANNPLAIQTRLEAAFIDNANLIKTIPSKYLDQVSQIVSTRMRGGYAPSVIAKDLQKLSGVTRKRAKLIARDQTAKLNSELTEGRFKGAGIEHFRWRDSNDRRVSGKPGGKYPDAKIKCHHIARRDIGFGPGVYRIDKGASYGGESGLMPGRAHIQCRCTYEPVFPWELPVAA